MAGSLGKGRSERSIARKADAGELLHAKHAFPPNALGYCGPDVRGKIEEFLHGRSRGDSLLPYLKKFEAAYPFVRMIGKSNGLDPFDYRVTEAYWLGNSLLDRVNPSEFYKFTQQDLATSRRVMAGKKDSMNYERAKLLFKKLGHAAKPHHTFYVLDMFANSVENLGARDKILELMDSCRISWGEVIEVRRRSLVVERPSLLINRSNQLVLSPPQRKEVTYDPDIPPFDSIRKGECVSLHWNFASEKLSLRQLKSLIEYTELDIQSANSLPETSEILE